MSANLIIQTAFLGDLLLSIPLIKRCRQQWPEDKVYLVCRKGFGSLFLQLGLVDRCFEISKGDSGSYEKIKKELLNENIKNIISPHESLRTAFFVRSLVAQQKWSFKKWWSFLFYSNTVVKPQALPDALRQLSLLTAIDSDLSEQFVQYIRESEQAGRNPLETNEQGQLPPPPEWGSMNCVNELHLVAEPIYSSLEQRFPFLKEFAGKKIALLFPGSVWATKRWTAQGFIETAKGLQQRGFHVVLMGGPGEEALSREVSQALTEAYDLTGKTSVVESLVLISRASLVVANDSASAHLAAVAETPVIAVFGPTVLKFGYRPWGAQVWIAENKTLSCRPCGKHGHHRCPLGTHECMKSVSASDVLTMVP